MSGRGVEDVKVKENVRSSGVWSDAGQPQPDEKEKKARETQRERDMGVFDVTYLLTTR